MKKFLLAILTVAALSPANAADVRYSTKDTPSQVLLSEGPARSWTGLWAAAMLGYSMSNTELGFDRNDHDGGFERALTVDGFGGENFDGTLQLGGDVQVRGLVIGGWAEYTFGGTESQISVNGFGSLKAEQNDSYALFARVGVPVNDTLFYAAGGYVWTEADVSLTGNGSATFDFQGPAAEVGIEHRFSPNVRGRLSGRYTFLDSETLAGGGDEDCFRITGEPGILSLKAGVVISTGGLFGGGY